jgi:RDD family
MAFVRDICHALDTLTFYIGWLFPLWDPKRQTFADKIM